jgi:hypothetical protein
MRAKEIQQRSQGSDPEASSNMKKYQDMNARMDNFESSVNKITSLL